MCHQLILEYRLSLSSSPVSVVDIFLPGFTNISAAIQQLQVSDSNGFARMLCICGIIVFLAKYAYTYLKAVVETYFSSWLLSSGDIF
jgi:chaperone BCS1